jgi:isopenicillin N synthase-like dioxygenase
MQLVSLNQWQRDWFWHMERIWRTCSVAHLAYAIELDRLQPGFQFAERARRWEYLNCLRLLRYVAHTGDLAKSHTDRSASTFHVAETRPGFQTRHGFMVKEQESPTAPDVLVFTGDQMEEITCGGIARRWHEVLDTSGGQEERFAMVFFCKMFTGKL